MGLFDNIVCKYPLPDGFTGQEFITSDLDAYILPRTHVIEADGSLWLDEGHEEEVPGASPNVAPEIPAGTSSEVAERLRAFDAVRANGPPLRWVQQLVQKTDFDGEINFRTNTGEARFYKAILLDGKVAKIKGTEIVPVIATGAPGPAA